MNAHLFIVAWNRPDLWDYWKRWFSGVENVEVILDRRRGERRQPPRAFEPERRGAERRCRSDIDDELHTAGFAIVTR
jgi:hypothetical protein